MVHVVEIAKNIALSVPWVRHRRAHSWRRRGCGRNTTAAAYVREVFDTHSAAINRHRPISGRVLEIGPGATLAIAALFAQAGAEEAVAIDVVDWREDVPGVYRELGIDAETLARVRYDCPCGIEEAPFPDESFDIVVSQASFQKFTDPEAATANIARILRPGGITTHHIDLRDNRDFSKPLEFLKLGDLAWDMATSRRSPTNRWRASDIEAAFAKADLVLLERVVTRQTTVSEEQAATFAPRFRAKSLADLAILGLFVVAAKPLEPAPRLLP